MTDLALPELGVPGWAIVELLGHRRLGGWVTEVELFGAKQLRLDVPSAAEPSKVYATQVYSPKALYSFTPCSEGEARTVASYSQPAPMLEPQLPGRHTDDDDESEEFSDEQCARCSKRELETVCNDESSGWTYDSEDGWLCPTCSNELLHAKGDGDHTWTCPKHGPQPSPNCSACFAESI